MGITDFYTLGEDIADIAKGKAPSQGTFAGSFGVTLGTVINGIYGARNTHIIGTDTTVTFDIISVLESLVGKLTPSLDATVSPGVGLVGGLLSGLSGKSDIMFGPKLTATYMGPDMTVRRARKIERISDDSLAKGWPFFALLALAVTIIIALELTAKFKYQYTTSSDDATAKLVADLGPMLANRVLGFLRWLELSGAWADLLEKETAKLEEYPEGGMLGVNNMQSIKAFFEGIGTTLTRAGEWIASWKGFE